MTNQTIQNIMSQVPTDVSGKWVSQDQIAHLIKLVAAECNNICMNYAQEIVAAGDFAAFEFRGHGAEECAELISEQFEIHGHNGN